jgi:hypothetical protein
MDGLIRASRKATGLTDFGKDFDDEPLEKLLWSINNEAELHPVGRFISKQRLVSLLNIRLRAEEMFLRYPEILEAPLYPAWVILGLQRTGTTKIQRLLASDPRHRVLESWEAINPSPWKINPGQKDKRISIARTSVNALKYLAPGFFAIHPIGVHLPEEDILLLDVSFLSTTPEATMHVPTYASWLEKTDQSSAYAYEVKLLKLLQWQRPASRWILKSPHHMEFLPLIEKHFPEVSFIWMHRNVYESIPSFLSMVAYSNALFSNRADLGRIAHHWVRKSGFMLEKALDYREKEGKDQKFTDVFYDRLFKDPIPDIKRIYQQNGGLSADLLEKFIKTDQANPYRKYGTHKYDLGDFGLTPSDIDEVTGHYTNFIASKYADR